MTSKQTDPDLQTHNSLQYLRLFHPLLASVHNSQFVDIWVEYPVDKANTRRLVGICIRELDVDLPEPAFEWGYDDVSTARKGVMDGD